MSSTTDTLKVLALIATIALAGFFLYKTTANRGAGQAGQVIQQAVVSKCIINSFTATPTNLPNGGGSAVLSWSMSNTCVSASISGIGAITPVSSGTYTVPNITATTTFTLTGLELGGVPATATATVTVAPPPVCTINSFTATPMSIASGATSTLAWSTSNCTSTSISTIGAVTPVASGSHVTPALTATTTYTLTAVGTNTTTAQATVIVTPPPPCSITSFTANPSSIASGASSTLSWVTTNCLTTSINQGIGSVTPVSSGSHTTGALTQTTTYTLTAVGTNTTTAQTTVTVTTSSCSNTWTQKAYLGGVARYSAAGFSIGTKGYIGTGYDMSTLKKDFWQYDQTTNAWTQKADFGGGFREGAVGLTINGKGYVGTGDDGSYKKDFWEYNPTTNIWTQKADFGGTARTAATGFSIGSKGYLGSGYYNGTSVIEKDFWEYNPTTNIWTQKADFGGGKRYLAVGFSIGPKGYVGTGEDDMSGPAGIKKDLWEYNPTTNAWTQKADFGGIARAGAVGFAIGTKGYIGTGTDGSGNASTAALQDFWEYNPTTNAWTQKANLGGVARYFATGFKIGTKGYIGTGLTNSFVKKKDLWEYCQ